MSDLHRLEGTPYDAGIVHADVKDRGGKGTYAENVEMPEVRTHIQE